MKHRRIARALLLLLCAAMMLSGTLLILHADHACHQTACPVCMALTQNIEAFVCTAVVFAGVGMLDDMYHRRCEGAAENRFAPDWTPVRRKVKLLN